MLDDALDQSELIVEGNVALAAAADRAREAGVAAVPAMHPANGHTIASVILAQADSLLVDLIVLGTHGRTGLRRAILGSVAEEVIRGSRVPVLLPGRSDGGSR